MKNILKTKKYNLNIILKIVQVMIAISIILFLIGSINEKTLAKYTSLVQGQVLANISTPIVEIIKEEKIEIDLSENKRKYNFEVRNFNKEQELNEVEIDYYIEILPQTDYEMNYKLYMQSQENEQLIEIPLVALKTDFIPLSNQEKQIYNFILEIDATEEVKEKTSIERSK